MLEYNIWINNGAEALGTTGKTLTVNEAPRLVSLDFIVDELKHCNELVPERTIKDVLTSFTEVAARLMAEGFIVPLCNEKGEVAARCYADMHLKSGNINLAKARELMPEEVTDEASMMEHAAELVDRVGIRIAVKMETEQKFNDLMQSFKPKLLRKGIEEKAYVPKKDGQQDGQSGGDGGDGGNGGTDNNGGDSDNGDLEG